MPTTHRLTFHPKREGRDGVDGGRGTHGIAVQLHRGPGGKRVDRHRETEGEVSHPKRPPDHFFGIRRPVDVERLGTVVEAHALDEAGEAEKVVAVEMGQEDPGGPA